MAEIDHSGSESWKQSFLMAHVNTEFRKNMDFWVEYEPEDIGPTLLLHQSSILFLTTLL